MLAGPGVWWRAADAVRDSLRDSVAHRPDDQRALVPALVDGDDGGARPRAGRGLPAHRPDPPARGLGHQPDPGRGLRAAARALGRCARPVARGGGGGRDRGFRPGGPHRAERAAGGGDGDGRAAGARARRAPAGHSRARCGRGRPAAGRPGAGADGRASRSRSWRRRGSCCWRPGGATPLRRWLPGWAADAVAVPTAAQLACTPLVAALSGQVSLVAVVANLLAAPAVAPATVLGLAGALLGLVWAPAGAVAGTLASWCVAWIVLVARAGADLPAAAVGWGTGALALALLDRLCLVVALAGPVPACGAARPGPRARRCWWWSCWCGRRAPGGRRRDGWWPRATWGRATRSCCAPGRARPWSSTPAPTRRPSTTACDRLDVTEVPLVVLTHFHADHVDGLPAVLSGRRADRGRRDLAGRPRRGRAGGGGGGRRGGRGDAGRVVRRDPRRSAT